MDHNPSEQARQRLTDLLDPITDRERELVQWLRTTLSVPGPLVTLIAMLERNLDAARRAGVEDERRRWHAALWPDDAEERDDG